MLHHTAGDKLSTGDLDQDAGPVDDCPVRYLGMVVPKRFAKRSVTRNLVKRQMRAAMLRHIGGLGAGHWVVRLRAPIDRKLFPSARSVALAVAVRTELDQMLSQLAASHQVIRPS